jgi:hypothetical protein
LSPEFTIGSMVASRMTLRQRGQTTSGTGDCNWFFLADVLFIEVVIAVSLHRPLREREHTLSLSH